MVKLGIALIVVAVAAPLVALVFGVFGLFALASAASWVYFASPILVVLGILLVVLGGRRRSPQGPAR